MNNAQDTKDYSKLLPAAVLEAMRQAVLSGLDGQDAEGFEVIYSQSGLLGDYLAFVHCGEAFYVVQATQVTGKRTFDGRGGADRHRRQPSWTTSVLRCYTPAAPNQLVYTDINDL